MLSLPLLILAGPTASGKSEVALELAARLGAEIISADSMQVYRGFDILSAKPSAAERARIPHHAIDLAEVAEDFTVAQWLISASDAIEAIRGRGRQPLVVGGTGLYVRALRFGIDPNPPTPPELRDALATRTLPDLVAELRLKDPGAAARIDMNNRRRVERALAIVSQGGHARQESWQAAPAPAHLVVLRREADDLRERIARRIEAMFAAGAVEEVARLRAAGLRPGTTAWQALGVRQIADLLDRRCPEAEARAQTTIATRQFAKRQMTWFRREPEAKWLDVPSGEHASQTASRVLGLL